MKENTNINGVYSEPLSKIYTILTTLGTIYFNAVRTRNVWNEMRTGKFLSYDQFVVGCTNQTAYIPVAEISNYFENNRKEFNGEIENNNHQD